MASPFSFHCIVCFEEFAPERYPVVLPCGHTYVCNICSERLERCMECRTPLVEKVVRKKPPPNNRNAGASGWSSARSGAGTRSPPLQPAPTQKPAPPQKPAQRLPWPKNVVLISLMEATELTTEQQAQPSNSEDELTPALKASFSDEEAEKIKIGTSLTAGMSGTYAVAATDGLVVFPSRPARKTPQHQRRNSAPSDEEQDVESLVRFHHLDNKINLSSSAVDSVEVSEQFQKEQPSIDLRRGDRIQIVSWEDGWAKLARGYGFVKADANQLVKVGGSVDRACNLEALLHSLSRRRKELRKEQNKVDSDFVTLMKYLQNSLINDEDLTVIGADTFVEADSKVPCSPEAQLPAETQKEEERGSPDSFVIDKPDPLLAARPETPPILEQSRFACFSEDVLSAFTGGPCNSEQPLLDSTSRMANLADGIGGALSFDDTTPFTGSPTRQKIPTFAHPSPGALSAGAQAWREQHGRTASRGIDFRTGMSGHTGLTANRHPHDYLRNRPARMMSSHTGLSGLFGARRVPHPQPSLAHPATMPTLEGSTCSGDTDEVEESKSNETV